MIRKGGHKLDIRSTDGLGQKCFPRSASLALRVLYGIRGTLSCKATCQHADASVVAQEVALPGGHYKYLYTSVRGNRARHVLTMYVSLVSWTATTLLVSVSCALQPFDEWNHGRIQFWDVSIHLRYSESGEPPLLLIHGFPEHSPTWIHIGPILAEHYTVIAPDNRGMGESSLAANDNYTAVAGGEDHIALLNFLNINQAYVFAHDKGVGVAASLALEHPDRIAKLVLAEYVLPGYGYPTSVTSTDPYYN